MTGATNFSDRTLSRIINSAATSVPGVEVITSSWAEIGTRSYPRCDLRLDFHAHTLQVDSFLAVSFPAPVTDVAAKVRTNIHTWVKAMTGLEATHVNVTVEQTLLRDHRLSQADLNSGPSVPRLQPIHVRPGREPRSPKLPAERPLVSPRTAPPRPLRSPTGPSSWEAWAPELPEPTPVRSPRVPPERALRPIITQPAASLVAVPAPVERQVRRVR